MRTLRGLVCAMIAAGAFALPACGDDGRGSGGANSDSDGDGDTDSDPDTDSGSDSDTGADAGADAGTDTCSGDGVWYDEEIGLCWQNPPSADAFIWDNAVAHCAGLYLAGHDDWRLPNIDEVISLLRGCQSGIETGDLSPSLCEMTPDGCATTDTCGGVSNCDYCDSLSGPGDGGCYRDPALTGNCDFYWSSSSLTYEFSFAWSVNFAWGDMLNDGKSCGYYVRCVRGGP